MGEVRDSGFLNQRSELCSVTSVRASAMVSPGRREGCQQPRPALFLGPRILKLPKQVPEVRKQEGECTK